MSRRRIEESLRAEGQVDSAGVFSVDRQGALEKLRQFQLADPRDYVLNLVAGAVALGAQSIDFRLDGRRTRVVMTGVVLPPDFIEQPLSFLFVNPDRVELEGYRELAIGLCAAQFLQPSRVLITSGGQGCVLRDLQTELQPKAETGSDTVVEITHRTSLRQLLGSDAQSQLQVLQDKAGCCPVPFTLNGERVRPADTARPFLESSSEVDMWLGERPGHVQFIKYGVQVCERMLTLKTPLASARINADGLLKNVSGSDVVEDDRYLQVLGELDRACDRWLVKVCADYGAAPPRLQARVRPQLLQAVASRDLESLPSGLVDLPLFETIDGQHKSIHDLRRYLESHRKLRHVHGDVPLRSDVSKFILRLREAWTLQAVEAVFGRTAVAVKNPTPPPLPLLEGSYLITWPFQEQGYTGYLGILREPDPYARVTCWRRGQLVAEKTWGASGVPYRMALQHNLSEWKDQDLQDVAEEVLEDVCCWLGRTIRPPHPESPTVQRVLLAWLAAHPQDRPPQILQDYPLFETADGRTVSWLDLRGDHDKFGAVHHAVGVAAGSQTDGRHVVVDPAAVSVLGQLFPKVLDYRTHLLQQRKAQAPARVAATPPLCPVSLKSGSWQIEAGVNAERSVRARRWDTILRFQVPGSAPQPRSVALEFGPLDVTIESPDLAGGVTEAHVASVVAALREGGGVLAENVSETLLSARDWQQDRLREFLLRYLAWKGEVPEALLDTPIFIGLGRAGVSVRQLRAGGTVRYVSHDVGPLEVSRPVLVCTRAAAEGVSRIVRRPPENWEHGLSERLLHQAYMMRPEASLQVSDKCFHVETAPPLRIGFLPPAADYDGQSQVRIVWQGRLLDTVQIEMIVPVDVVVTDESLTPGPSYESVNRDAEFERVMRSIESAVVAAIDTLCQHHTEEAARDALLRWALAQCDGRESILLSPPNSRLGRVARLPLLVNVFGNPAALRDVAAQERCLYVPSGEAWHDVQGDLIVDLPPLHEAWMATVFDMRSVAREAAPELSANPLLRAVQECLSAHGPSRPFARRLVLGSGHGALLSHDEATGLVTVHQEHPSLREPGSTPLLAVAVYSLLASATMQQELDFLMHVADWICDADHAP